MTSSPFPVKPFRFGVQLSGAPDLDTWLDQAHRAEAQGYAVATMPDHFSDQLAPVPALQAILDHTTTLRAGALVFDNDYKHPVVLAKELATMDVLSGGRIEIGLGAGWMRSDYEQAGIPYDRAGVRIDRFEEGIAVIRGAMGDGPFSFSGEHYTITGYDGAPKPVQTPCPPILVGGGGPRVLSIAARQADIVGVNGTMHEGMIGPGAIASMTEDAVVEKVGIVAGAARDRIDHVEMNIRVFFVSVTDDRQGALDGIAGMIGVDPSMVAASPFALIGNTASIVEELVARRERFGFSYIIVGADDIDDFAPVVAELAGK